MKTVRNKSARNAARPIVQSDQQLPRRCPPFGRMAVGIAAGMALTALLACGTAAARTITVAVATGFTTLDPYDAGDALSRNVAKSFYEGLYAFNDKLEPQPQLAESYEVSEYVLEYVFKLREGVKFHDGTEFDAQAVKVNFDRVLDPKNALSRRTFFGFIDRVEVLDKYRVKFILKMPMSAFISRLANGTGQMICPSAIKKLGSDGLAHNACGTGPYVLKEFNPSERLVVEKNPNYRIAGLPKLDGIRWLPVPENSTRAQMVLTGEADYVHAMPPELMGRVNESDQAVAIVKPSIQQRYLAINTLAEPLNDLRVRQAIAYAINKDAFCKVVYGGFSRPATGVQPPEVPGGLKLGPWPYDPKKARELLKEAGYPNGFRTQIWAAFNTSTNAKAVQFLQQQLRQVGIQAETRVLESGQRVSLVDSHPDPKTAPVRLYLIGWSNSTAEPDWGIRPLFDSREVPPKLGNTSYYNNPAMDAALDRGMAETDLEKRLAAYGEAQKMIWNDVPAVFLTYENNLAAVNRHLKNFRPMLDSTFEFYEAYWQE